MSRIADAARPGAIALKVADLERLLAFYQRLGLQVHWRDGHTAGLGVGESDLLRLTQVDRGLRDAGAAGLYHFALLLPERLDLARTLRHLAAERVPLSGFADHLVSEAVYLSDPEGNGIEIYRDRPRNEWAYGPDGTLDIDTVALDLDGLMAELAGNDEPWRGMPAGTQVGHIHLHVGSLEASLDFYRGALGFDLVAHYGRSAAFVAAGGYHHHIGYNLWGGRAHRPADALGLDWFEIRLPDSNALDAVLERLRRAGLTVERTEHGHRVPDPSGNQILLNADA